MLPADKDHKMMGDEQVLDQQQETQPGELQVQEFSAAESHESGNAKPPGNLFSAADSHQSGNAKPLRLSSRDIGDDGHYYECVICDNGGDLLCCDKCPCVYHLECLTPPLESVPTGSWECSNCGDLDDLVLPLIYLKRSSVKKATLVPSKVSNPDTNMKNFHLPSTDLLSGKPSNDAAAAEALLAIASQQTSDEAACQGEKLMASEKVACGEHQHNAGTRTKEVRVYRRSKGVLRKQDKVDSTISIPTPPGLNNEAPKENASMLGFKDNMILRAAKTETKTNSIFPVMEKEMPVTDTSKKCIKLQPSITSAGVPVTSCTKKSEDAQKGSAESESHVQSEEEVRVQEQQQLKLKHKPKGSGSKKRNAMNCQRQKQWPAWKDTRAGQPACTSEPVPPIVAFNPTMSSRQGGSSKCALSNPVPQPVPFRPSIQALFRSRQDGSSKCACSNAAQPVSLRPPVEASCRMQSTRIDDVGQPNCPSLSSLGQHNNSMINMMGTARSLQPNNFSSNGMTSLMASMSLQPNNFSTTNQTVTVEGWFDEELDALWVGVRRYGEGQWLSMLQDPKLNFSKYKSPAALEKRWKVEKRKIIDSLDLGKAPLTQPDTTSQPQEKILPTASVRAKPCNIPSERSWQQPQFGKLVTKEAGKNVDLAKRKLKALTGEKPNVTDTLWFCRSFELNSNSFSSCERNSRSNGITPADVSLKDNGLEKEVSSEGTISD